MIDRVLRSFACLLFLASSLTTGLASAAQSPTQFNLPSQALAESLKVIATQSNLNVLVNPQLVDGRKALALAGRLTPAEALGQLLAGTDLEYRFVNEQTVVIRQKREPAAPSTATGASTRPGVSTQLRLADSAPAAQEGATETAAREKKTATEEEAEVVVKGVKDTGVINQGVIPRKENEALRYNIIDRAAIVRSGATSVPDLFRSLSSNATVGTDTQQILITQSALIDGIVPVNNTVNLRGLGPGQTLVMVNGRRLFGGEGEGADLTRIPIDAIERIEILPTSGSAIYGADAVGGVVNIVLRKDYEGSEVAMYFGTADGQAAERRITLHKGFRFNDNRTNVALIADVESRDALRMGDRRYYERALARIPPNSPVFVSQIVRSFVTPTVNVVGGAAGLGIPGDPTAVFAAKPQNADGAAGLTPASFSGTARQAALGDGHLANAKLLTGDTAYSLFTTLEHSMFDGRVGAYAELSYRYSDNSAGDFSGLVQPIRLGATHPYNPFRTDVTPGFVGRAVTLYFDPVDLPGDSATSYQRTMRAVGGLKGHFNWGPQRIYNWAIDVSWDRNETHSYNLSYTRNLGPAVNAMEYDPFRDLADAAPITGAALANFARTVTTRDRPQIAATNWRINGDLFRVWGGAAKFSLGLEARIEKTVNSYVVEAGSYGDLPDSFFGDLAQFQDLERRATAAYAETTIPLVGEKNRLPGLYALEVVAATRLEKYTDFAAASPPMFGIKWAPLQDIALRATYSEGFEPPPQSALTMPVDVFPLSDFGVVDPQRGFEEVTGNYLSGGNPNLRPETSDTWDIGVIVTPRFAPGLTLAANYYRYDKFDLIGYLDPQTLVDLVPGRVTRGDPLPDDPPGTPGPITLVDATAINLARQFVDGWDYKVDYVHELSGSRSVGISGDATQTQRYGVQDLPGFPLVNRVGDQSVFGPGLLRWRGKLSLWLETANMSWSWTSRYFDSYITDTTTPTDDNPARSGVDGRKIPSTLEHDLVFNYTFANGSNSGSSLRSVFNNTRWTLGALNIFDHAPPVVSGRFYQWYSGFSDPRERVIYIQGRKAF